MPLAQPVITRNFYYGDGKPEYVKALSGIEAIDIHTGFRYVQRFVPYGSKWEFVDKWHVLSLNPDCCEEETYETTPETPSGPIDGNNNIFELLHPPAHPQALILALDGRVMEFGIDYVVIGSTIYMSFPPGLGSEIYVIYKRADTQALIKTPMSALLSAGADGVETVFYLPTLPEFQMEVIITLDGNVQTSGVDFNVSGTLVTFIVPPGLGSEVHAYYDFFPEISVATVPAFERLVGAADGVNTIFTIDGVPAGAETVILFINSGVQYRDIDYTVSGSTITTLSPPAIGSILFVFYYARDASQDAGYFKQNTKDVDYDYNLSVVDYEVSVDASTGNKIITLPLANVSKNHEFVVDKNDISGNSVRLQTQNGELLAGGATFFDLLLQDENLSFISNGTRYRIT